MSLASRAGHPTVEPAPASVVQSLRGVLDRARSSRPELGWAIVDLVVDADLLGQVARLARRGRVAGG